MQQLAPSQSPRSPAAPCTQSWWQERDPAVSSLHPKNRGFGSSLPSAPELLCRSSPFPSPTSAFLCCPALASPHTRSSSILPCSSPGPRGRCLPSQESRQQRWQETPARSPAEEPTCKRSGSTWGAPHGACQPWHQSTQPQLLQAWALVTHGHHRSSNWHGGLPKNPWQGFPPSKGIGGQLLTAQSGAQCLPQLILQPAAPPAALGGLLGPRVGATRWVSLPPAFSLSTNIAFAEGANGNCSHMEAESAAKHFAY